MYMHTPIRADMYSTSNNSWKQILYTKLNSTNTNPWNLQTFLKSIINVCVCVLLYWQDTELRFVIHAHIIACFYIEV